MARRAGLPAHILVDLPARAAAGRGLDPDVITITRDGVMSAADAREYPPSAEMLTLVRQITGYLYDHGGRHVSVDADLHGDDHPGHLTVRWAGTVSPRDVAEAFAVSRAEDGTPRLPSWLNLRADAEFDLRWQPPY